MTIHTLRRSASVLALASSLAMACGGLAAAQTTPQATTPPTSADAGTTQEVVVTAERRTTNLQNTPIAATVLTGQDLIKKGVFTVDQLQFVSPSLTVNNFGQGDDFDIRGIGKGEHNSQTSTGVVTYRDGVATFPGYFAEEPYFDIADVEVLRGPQGTFSGQNATGGAVIVNSQDPKIGGGYTGYLLGHYGNYNDTGLQGAVNIPINDTLAARVAFNGEYRDTFYHINGLTGDPNVYWGSARFSLLWEPINSLKVLFKVDYDYLDNGGYFGDNLANQENTSHLFSFSNNYETFAVDQFVRAILKVDYVAPDGITFRSVGGYQQGRTAWKGDIDGTNLTAPNEDYFIAEAVNERIWSQEFNIISPDKGPFSWIVGAYYQNNRYDFPTGRFDIGLRSLGLDEDLNGVNPTYTDAVFGQATYKLPAGFEIQAGLRYSNWSTTNRATFDVPQLIPYGYSFPVNQTETGSNVTGKITLNWNLDRNNFLYVFVASGAKPGGLNTSLYFGGGILPPPFKQETVTDYEFGWKTRLFDNHLRVQLGAYYNDFKNFQVIVPIPNNPLQATEINNPSATKLYGIEGSAQAVFGDLSFNGGFGLEHSSLGKVYSEDPRAPVAGTSCSLTSGPVGPGCIDLQGHPQTYAPDFTFNLGAQYNVKLSDGDILTPAVTFAHISDQWATLFDNRAAGDHLTARNILGASLAWTHGSFTTTLYGYNLTDDHYIAAIASPIRLAGPPRQFGVSVMKLF